MSKSLTKLPKKFRKAGLEVRVVKGWKQRGSGLFVPKGVLFHHTASAATSGPAPCLGICTHGRSDLAGPLCNILIGRDSIVRMIAAGRANHAGEGGPFRGIPEDSGNMYFVGFEVENNGVGEKWSHELLDTCTTAFAVTLRFLGSEASLCAGHKEWAPLRKIDPNGVSMRDTRDEVREKMRKLDKHNGRLH